MPRVLLVVSAGVLSACLTAGLLAQQRGAQRRAQPPTFNSSGAFFPDIFQQLDGARPASGGAGTPVTPGGNPTPGGPPMGNPGGSGGEGAWAGIISPTTLEDEIKANKLLVDQTVTTPTDFRGKGYIEARTQFTMIATMLAVIGEYNGDVRWKDKAPGAREVFARSAANCKVGTVQAYNEAKIRKEDLEILLGGGALDLPPAEAKVTDWSTVCDRNPLMKRLRLAQRDNLSPLLANEGEFKGNTEKVLHEAETIAVIAEILKQETMVDGTEADYQEFCESMKKGGLQIVDAVKLGSYENARSGLGDIMKACDLCHEAYR